MSRDYKPSAEKPKSGSKGSPFLTGLLVGFLLGIAASLSVVMFIKGGESPFTNNAGITNDPKKFENLGNADADKNAAENNTDAKDDPNRFDFYTILPGSESQVTEDEIKKNEEEAQPVVENSYYLQIGAFQTEEEADNLKAKLALQGFEAVVQTATIPDKGVWHRVRVGPLNDLEQINSTKSELAKNGFKADLIKVNTNNQ